MAFRTHNRNSNFFANPNINNAYWVGLLAADGNMDITHTHISLEMIEQDLVTNFAIALEYTGQIGNRKRKGRRSFYVKIRDKKLCQDLLTWNITPQKSLILEPPTNLVDDQILSYIIGYVDGDGWICKNKNSIEFGCCGTYNMMTWIAKHIGYTNQVYKNHSVFKLQIGGKKAQKIVDKLNRIKTPFRLQRKWNIGA